MSKLTKRQQDFIGRVITEQLADVMSGRMEDVDEDVGMESRVNHDVVGETIKNSSNVRSIARDVCDPAAQKFEARAVKVIAAALRQNGVGAISPNDVDDILTRSHAGQFEELGEQLRDQMAQLLVDHAAELANLVVAAIQDEDV
jgi:hypothetical protein